MVAASKGVKMAIFVAKVANSFRWPSSKTLAQFFVILRRE
jgi:hypothetical protein